MKSIDWFKFKTAFSNNYTKSLILIMVMIVLLGLISFQVSSSSMVDPTTHCSTEKVPSKSVVIIYDNTDLMKKHALESAKSRTLSLKETLQGGDRLSIFWMGPDDQSKETLRVWSACKPIKKSNLTQGSIVYAEGLEKNWDQPINQVMSNLNSSKAQKSDTTNLLVTLRKVIDGSYLKGNQASMVVFSDKKENSNVLSMYRKNFKKFHTLLDEKNYFVQIKDLLEGVEVEVFELSNSVKNKSIEDWWTEYYLTGAADFNWHAL